MYQQPTDTNSNSGTTNISTRDVQQLGVPHISNQNMSGGEQHTTSSDHEVPSQVSSFQEIRNFENAQTLASTQNDYNHANSHEHTQSQCIHPVTDIQQKENRSPEHIGK